MASVNKVILIGLVGQDPVVHYVGETNRVARFSLATSEVYKKDGVKQTKTDWHTIVIWGKLAEIAENYVKKGSQVYIEGRLSNSKYTDKEGVERISPEIIASSLQLLDRKSNDGGSAKSESRPKDDRSLVDRLMPNEATAKSEELNPDNYSDDLPF